MNEKCKNILDLIPLYIDNPDDIDESTREHIENCPQCKGEFDLLTNIKKGLGALVDIEPSCDFSEKLSEKISKAQAQKRKKRANLFMRYGSGVAAAAVIALCVVSFGSFEKTVNTPPDLSAVPSVESVAQSKQTETANTEKPKENESVISNEKPVLLAEDMTPSGGGSSAGAPKESTPQKDIAPTDDLSSEEVFTDAAVLTEAAVFTAAEITLSDDTREAALEILAPYEMDETGYIVPDINRVLRKIAELGVPVEAKESSIGINYIIIK